MVSYRFTSDTPPDSLISNIQSSNRFSDDQFKELISICLSFRLEPGQSSRFMSQTDEFAQENGVGLSALKSIIKSLLTVLNGSLKNNLSQNQFKEDLTNLGLSEPKSEIYSDQYGTNLVGLSREALGQTLMVNQLVDMDWKFGVTAASSEVNKVGNTFLQLKLVINKGNKTEDVFMELSLPQFYSFLHDMEKANTSLEYFSWLFVTMNFMRKMV